MSEDPPIAASGLSSDPDIFKLLTEIDMVAHLAANEFERLLPKGLSQAQFGVLNRLMRLETRETVSELAHAFQVAQPTMSSTLKKLSGKGLIAMINVAGNRRAKHIMITEDGKRLRQEVVTSLTPYFTQFMSDMPEKDWSALLPAMVVLRAYFERRYGAISASHAYEAGRETDGS